VSCHGCCIREAALRDGEQSDGTIFTRSSDAIAGMIRSDVPHGTTIRVRDSLQEDDERHSHGQRDALPHRTQLTKQWRTIARQKGIVARYSAYAPAACLYTKPYLRHQFGEIPLDDPRVSTSGEQALLRIGVTSSSRNPYEGLHERLTSAWDDLISEHIKVAKQVCDRIPLAMESKSYAKQTYPVHHPTLAHVPDLDIAVLTTHCGILSAG